MASHPIIKSQAASFLTDLEEYNDDQSAEGVLVCQVIKAYLRKNNFQWLPNLMIAPHKYCADMI
jgi:hypothetical protein